MTDERPDNQPNVDAYIRPENNYDETRRYFKIDEGYDKRMYENTWCNILFIIAIFVFYYICNVVVFLG